MQSCNVKLKHVNTCLKYVYSENFSIVHMCASDKKCHTRNPTAWTCGTDKAQQALRFQPDR